MTEVKSVREVHTWSYTESVERMRPLVRKWKMMTVEMLEELWIARDALSQTGRPESGTNGPLIWGSYCEEIELPKRTANRWLSKYDHESRKLIEEPKPSKTLKAYLGQLRTYTLTPYIEALKRGELWERAPIPWSWNDMKVAVNSASDIDELTAFNAEMLRIGQDHGEILIHLECHISDLKKQLTGLDREQLKADLSESEEMLDKITAEIARKEVEAAAKKK